MVDVLRMRVLAVRYYNNVLFEYYAVFRYSYPYARGVGYGREQGGERLVAVHYAAEPCFPCLLRLENYVVAIPFFQIVGKLAHAHVVHLVYSCLPGYVVGYVAVTGNDAILADYYLLSRRDDPLGVAFGKHADAAFHECHGGAVACGVHVEARAILFHDAVVGAHVEWSAGLVAYLEISLAFKIHGAVVGFKRRGVFKLRAIVEPHRGAVREVQLALTGRARQHLHRRVALEKFLWHGG